jgi:hypothetical protein
MGRCNYANIIETTVYDDGTELPASICDKKATWTFVVKTMDIGECTGKGIYHVCESHIKSLKESFAYKTEKGKTTYCPSCHKYHKNAVVRYRFRKGIY